MRVKRLIVRSLEDFCAFFHRFDIYWCHWFASWSADLDARWGTGIWTRQEPRQ